MTKDKTHRRGTKRAAEEHLFAGRWADAARLYEDLSRSGQDFGWLVERLRWRESRASAYRLAFGNEGHRACVAGHFRDTWGLTVECVETAPAKTGFIGVAAFVHTLDVGGGKRLKIHEKVFGTPDAEKVVYEAKLFAHYPASVLHAPDFFGTRTSGDFISAYYAHIDGTPVAKHEWPALQNRLVEGFWVLEPRDAIRRPEASAYPTILGLVDRLESFPVLRVPGGAARLHDAVEVVRRNVPLIASTIERMPKFPLHRDLNLDNALRDGQGRIFLVDWEKWSFEPVGFGWLSELPLDQAPKPDLAKLARSRRLFPGCDVHHLLMLSSLWQLRNALANDSHGSLGWLERLAAYCERIGQPVPKPRARAGTEEPAEFRYPDFLCIGAQKAGTTWLDRNLRRHPKLSLPPVKELQYFSHVHIPSARESVVRQRWKRGSQTLRYHIENNPPERWDYHRIARLADIVTGPVDDAWYGRIFTLAKPDQLCGEITPRYGTLSYEGIRHILKLSPQVRIILSLRDPVARSWSHIRMLAQERGSDDLAVLEEFARSEDQARRADYPTIIANWRRFVPDDRLLIVFMDDIEATPDTVLERVCSFLGVGAHEKVLAKAAEPVHVGRTQDIPQSVAAILKDRFRPFYEGITALYPEIGGRWMERHYRG